MGSFSLKQGDKEKILRLITDQKGIIQESLAKKMNLAVSIIWNTARARRPKINAQELKARGGKKGDYRVSDPNATLGVPVDTGMLRNSITKNVKNNGNKVQGIIEAGAGLKYALAIEYGTSKMQARPFIRPAINENAEKVKKIFMQKIEKI